VSPLIIAAGGSVSLAIPCVPGDPVVSGSWTVESVTPPSVAGDIVVWKSEIFDEGTWAFGFINRGDGFITVSAAVRCAGVGPG
jgi:hypothetical protein